MDATLSRKAAALKQSPYWRWMRNFNTDDENAQIESEWIGRLVDANTFENLSDEDKQLFRLGDRSEQIAQVRNLDPERPSELNKIIEEVMSRD